MCVYVYDAVVDGNEERAREREKPIPVVEGYVKKRKSIVNHLRYAGLASFQLQADRRRREHIWALRASVRAGLEWRVPVS